MQKISLPNIRLDCYMQQATELTDQEYHKGVICLNGNGQLRFEEEAETQSRWTRNPHIYEGGTINLTRKKDGSVKFNFKTVNVKADKFNASNYAFQVYNELLNALQILN